MWIYFELPNTDALGMARTVEEMDARLAKHGSPERYWDNLNAVWRVPAFREGRIRYEKMKVEDCARWGCE